MRLGRSRRSENVEDRRSAGPRRVALGGGFGMIILFVVALLFGADPRALMRVMQGNRQVAPRPAPGAVEGGANRQAQDDPTKIMIEKILGETEDVWGRLLPQQLGREYDPPKLVLFTGQVPSACGHASAAMGPFYCPADQKVYLDTSFFDDLANRHRSPGDFAQAYVIAHEVGHHVQNLLGISQQVQQLRNRLSQEDYNRYSVRLELQADFLAGVWAHHAHQRRGILEEGDIQEGMEAAKAIGDDRLQREAQGYVVPESFTHGTSEQRLRWFMKGLVSGNLDEMDTFAVDEL